MPISGCEAPTGYWSRWASSPPYPSTNCSKQTKALPWADWLPVNANFPVEGKSIKSKLFSVPDCQAIVKKAVVESLKQRYHRQWFEETGPRYHDRGGAPQRHRHPDHRHQRPRPAQARLPQTEQRRPAQGNPGRCHDQPEPLAPGTDAARSAVRFGHHPHRGRPDRAQHRPGDTQGICGGAVADSAGTPVAGGPPGGQRPDPPRSRSYSSGAPISMRRCSAWPAIMPAKPGWQSRSPGSRRPWRSCTPSRNTATSSATRPMVNAWKTCRARNASTGRWDRCSGRWTPGRSTY